MSLPKRIQQLQALEAQYLEGVYAAKRGDTLALGPPSPSTIGDTISTAQVTLRLRSDGSTLDISPTTKLDADGDEVSVCGSQSIRLVDIQQLVLHPDHGFSLRIRKDNSGATSSNASSSSQIFLAASSEVLNQWVLTLTCGANAFQQQQQLQKDNNNNSVATQSQSTQSLIWQTARLRIFELSREMDLVDAVTSVTQRVCDLLGAETQQQNAEHDVDDASLFFLSYAS
ncbi:hypothetical protein FI667_g15310, partial [Globisporangium splendens]